MGENRVNSTGFEIPEDFSESQKYFPTQPLNVSLFSEIDENYESVVYSYLVKQLRLDASIEKLNLDAPEEWTIAQMGSGRLHLQFLQFLIRLTRARRVLEIGTFVGLSAIAMAQALPNDGELITIEKFEKFRDLAVKNVQKNGLREKIQVLLGDAHEMLSTDAVEGGFDFMFIDGDKGRYLTYAELLLPKLSERGLMVVDDIFFQGDVFNNEPRSEKGRGVRDCLVAMTERPDLDVTFVPMTNGLMLIQRTS